MCKTKHRYGNKEKKIVDIQGEQSNNINNKRYSNIYDKHIKSSRVKKVFLYHR